uniref:Aquaporin 11 n=1 Tax=Cyclopterus lumpus TaxID=8103 RepID=A0A8C2XLK4_CYCLU
MADLCVSLAAVGGAVLLSEALRRAAARLVPGPGPYWTYLLEAAAAFQLCSCTHELKLLSEAAPPGLPLGLALTYVVTAVHLSTFRGAACNPCAALESVCRGRSGVGAAAVLVACQFAAAVAARFGFRCFDPLGGTLLEAAAAELGCAFAVQAAAMHAHKLDEKLRVHFIAAVVTALVYAGGGISGAMFNPVLAFSVQFPCSGHSYLEYGFVYWLGPALGMASCILLFEKIIPFLSGESANEPKCSQKWLIRR